ncbi:MAG: alpha/beta hydrolase-fold protein [Sporomusaceae bacterium]|nr:alpha/beta hydrolase-fold protein [Sporomusaceae bacterium]
MRNKKPVRLPLLLFHSAGDRIAVYLLRLRVQELAIIDLRIDGDLLGEAVVTAPDGSRLQGCELAGADRLALAFVADRAGLYRLEIRTTQGEPKLCAATLRKIVPLAGRRVSLSAPRLESGRIRQLRLELPDRPGALAEFWQQVEADGTPLLEADPQQPELTLCTFLWRGGKHVHHVAVRLFCHVAYPNDYQLVRLAGTDVWYTTVRLPARSRYAYTLLVNAPSLAKPTLASGEEHRLLYLAVSQADPLNPRRCYDEPGSRYEAQSLLEMPGAQPYTWCLDRPESRRGKLAGSQFASRLLRDSRSLAVYTPPDYSQQAGPYGLLLLFDGHWYLSRARAAVILDNLLAAGKIPPLVAAFVGNGPGDARSRQLPCNPDLTAFVTEELLPWLGEHYRLTRDPARRIIGGASYGGLAAAYTAIMRPDLFGNVLSQSGSFWWRPPQAECGEHYIASLIISRPLPPLQFYLEAGRGELGDNGSGYSLLGANRHLRDVLLAKGCPVTYREYDGGHGFLYWRGTLPDGLTQLTGGWRFKQ